MSNPFPNDQLICNTYVLLDIPSDTLVQSAELLQRYVELLPEKFRALDREKLSRRIITLRKLGHLPRLRRNARKRSGANK